MSGAQPSLVPGRHRELGRGLRQAEPSRRLHASGQICRLDPSADPRSGLTRCQREPRKHFGGGVCYGLKKKTLKNTSHSNVFLFCTVVILNRKVILKKNTTLAIVIKSTATSSGQLLSNAGRLMRGRSYTLLKHHTLKCVFH